MEHVLLQIGRKIREVRKSRKQTVQEIADRAGVSKGLISKIENNRTIPSLPVLLAIIRALEADINSFFEGLEFEPEQSYSIKRHGEFEPFEKESAIGFLYKKIITSSFGGNVIEVTLLELHPGSQRELVSTDGHELLFILKGEIGFELGEERLRLYQGDTFFFNGRIPHRPINDGTEMAEFLVVYILPKT